MQRWLVALCAVAMVTAGACGNGDDDATPDADDLEAGHWVEERIANIAHRGGTFEAPENTLYALGTAGERGADALELDVHATADGHAVVIHDSTLDRTTDGSGCVVEHTLEEIRSLDAAHFAVPGQYPEAGLPDEDYPWRGIATGDRPPPDGFDAEDFGVPTLDEVLDALPDARIVVEIKPTEAEDRDGVTHDCAGALEAMGEPERPDVVAEVARLIDEHDSADRVVVASFVDEMLQHFMELAPDVATAFPFDEGLEYFGAFATGEEPENPHGHVALMAPIDLALDLAADETMVVEFVGFLQERGIAVQVWTVNDEETMAQALGWGVDGIITDRVEGLDAVLVERGDPRP